MRRLFEIGLGLWLTLATATPAARASYAIYVGKNLTADGSVLLGGTGEEVSGHFLVIVPRTSHPPNARIEVGVTDEANFPGELIEIPQAPETFRYISMEYTDYLGFPPPLTNGGMNEHHVAIRDVWSTNRQELLEMTPHPQQGINYSDLARIMLQRARTARQAVEILGELIETHGYATYGGNSHLIADDSEGWVVLEMAGGQGLWVAERLGPDDVRVSYPGYIGEVPLDYLNDPDFMGSENLIDFAVDQGWFDPDAGEPFDVHAVYGPRGQAMRRPGIKFVDPATLEEELLALAPGLSVADLRRFVRDYRIADDEAGYGQVAHIRPDLPADLGRLWIAPTGSVTAPFVPYFIGVTSVPPEYGIHRYLYKDAGRRFLHPDYQLQEASEFAGRLFKRLMYYTCAHPDRFLPEVQEALVAFEARAAIEADEAEEQARVLIDAGRDEMARHRLTELTHRKAREALELGHDLLGSIEARSRLLHGPPPTGGTELHAATGRERRTVNCRDTMRDPHEGPTGPASVITIADGFGDAEEPPASDRDEDATAPWAFAGGLVIGIGAALLWMMVRARRR
jgi:hypothetical protein